MTCVFQRAEIQVNEYKCSKLSTKTEIHSPITTPEIICIMALTLQPIRGFPQYSGETGTKLTTAIHRRLFSRFFFSEGEGGGGRRYTAEVAGDKLVMQCFLMVYHEYPTCELIILCIHMYSPKSLVCILRGKKSHLWDISRYSTRKHCIPSIYIATYQRLLHLEKSDLSRLG